MPARSGTPSRRALLAACAALAALLPALAGCESKAPRRTPRVAVTVASSETRSVPYEIDATGTVEASEEAAVTAQVGGIITRLGFREGDEVRAGQLLVQIDPRPFQAAVDRAAATLARDRALAGAARLEFERATSLAAQQLISPGELDAKRSAWESLDATARADSAALASARLDLAYSAVRAPIGGRTGSLSARIGNVVKENDPAKPLVTVVQMRPARVRFTLTQADLPALQKVRGRALVVEAAPADRESTWVQGRLVFVDNAVDPASGTLLLKGEFANRDGALWPGAFVRVRLRLFEEQGAIVVPASAVSNSQSGTYVFVVKPDTTVEARPVKVARSWNEWSVIASGLAANETVVTDGQMRLSDGAKAAIRTPGAHGDGGGRGEGGAGAARGARAGAAGSGR